MVGLFQNTHLDPITHVSARNPKVLPKDSLVGGFKKEYLMNVHGIQNGRLGQCLKIQRSIIK